MTKTIELLRKSGAYDKNPQRAPKTKIKRDAQGQKRTIPKTPPRWMKLNAEERKQYKELSKQFEGIPEHYTTQVMLAAKMQAKVVSAEKASTSDMNLLHAVTSKLIQIVNFDGGEDENFE